MCILKCSVSIPFPPPKAWGLFKKTKQEYKKQKGGKKEMISFRHNKAISHARTHS